MGAPAASSSGRVRVLVADDHRLFADALTVLLAGEEAIECVGVAADGQQALEQAAELQPDVVLMDISMPVLDGFEATRQLRRDHPEVQVVVLTGSSAEQDVARARKAGASGYLTKDAIAANLVDAILQAARP
jgi:DNA-binding NarL/FixJ family response regulator